MAFHRFTISKSQRDVRRGPKLFNYNWNNHPIPALKANLKVTRVAMEDNRVRDQLEAIQSPIEVLTSLDGLRFCHLLTGNGSATPPLITPLVVSEKEAAILSRGAKLNGNPENLAWSVFRSSSSRDQTWLACTQDKEWINNYVAWLTTEATDLDPIESMIIRVEASRWSLFLLDPSFDNPLVKYLPTEFIKRAGLSKSGFGEKCTLLWDKENRKQKYATVKHKNITATTLRLYVNDEGQIYSLRHVKND